MLHPNQDLLLRFSAGAADEALALRITSHLGECRACTDRFLALRELRRDFDRTWDSFLEEAAFRAALPAAAVAPVTVLAAFRGLVVRSARLASAAVDRLTEAIPGGSLEATFVPAFSGVADARASAEARSGVEAASRAVAAGNLAEAMEQLRRAAGQDPDVSASAGVDLYRGGEVAGRIVVDGTRGSLSILIYPEILPIRRGQAILEAGPGGPESRLALAPLPGAPYLFAEFEGLPDGPFSVRVEFEELGEP